MQLELTAAQEAIRRECDEFTRRVLMPEAGAIDRTGAVPRRLIDELARIGYLGALAPTALGGRGLSFVELGWCTRRSAAPAPRCAACSPCTPWRCTRC